MRNFFILIIAVLFSFSTFAQRVKNIQEQSIQWVNSGEANLLQGMPSARTTAIGDTFTLSHTPASDTITTYTVGHNSGYVTGTNLWNDKAFAERYDFNGSDSSVEVLGVFALFAGKVNPASTQTVNFNVWGTTYPVAISGSLIYNSFPNTILDSVTAPVTTLGIGTTIDTLKKFLFASPTTFLPSSFFVGYSMNYFFDTATGSTLNGDNFGLACSKKGERYPAGPAGLYTLEYNANPGIDTTLDTILNVQNATQGSDNTWYDNYTQNDSIKNNLAIYPIVAIGHTIAGVGSITRNSLTFFGNYPNPATDYTNIRFSLSTVNSVTIMITNMSGQLIKTIQKNNLSTGEHLINVNTSELPAGDYLYLIHTSGGDGVAGKMSKLNYP